LRRREPYVTLDGSLVEELVRPEDGSEKVSLARYTVEAGKSTYLHLHGTSDEIYYVLAGSCEVEVGGERVSLRPGEWVFIPAGTPHRLYACEKVQILCICAPPYQHEDTELLEERGDGA